VGVEVRVGQLKEDGEEVLPYIAQILTNPGSDRMLDRAFIFASKNLTQYDCKRLVEPTVSHLTHHNWEIRSDAVWLLRTIGSRADTPPVVAMLYDEDKGVRVCAAGCLEKLGGKRELLALDIWLRDPTRLKDEACDDVKKSQNALRTRVEAEEKAKKEADPKKIEKK
jgi:HEAT repeat protein